MSSYKKTSNLTLRLPPAVRGILQYRRRPLEGVGKLLFSSERVFVSWLDVRPEYAYCTSMNLDVHIHICLCIYVYECIIWECVCAFVSVGIQVIMSVYVVHINV